LTAQLAVPAVPSVCFDAIVGDDSVPSAGLAASLRLFVSPVKPSLTQTGAPELVACSFVTASSVLLTRSPECHRRDPDTASTTAHCGCEVEWVRRQFKYIHGYLLARDGFIRPRTVEENITMGFFTHKTEVSDDLLEHGIRGKATVEKADMAAGMNYSGYMSEKTSEGLLTGDRTMVKYKLQLQIELPDREPYLAGVTLPVPGPKIRYMTGGSVCEVLVDPKKADHVAIDWNGTFQQGTIEQMAAANPLIAAAMKGAGVDIEAVSQMQRTAMAQGQTSGAVFVGGQLVSGGSVAAKPDPLDQLKKLAELHASGVVTDEEFATEKAKLLNS
jgi:hypothetical protein